jgi:hypothetical protein
MDKKTQDLQKKATEQSVQHVATKEAETKGDQKVTAGKIFEQIKTKDIEKRGHQKDANREPVEHTMTNGSETSPSFAKDGLEKLETNAAGNLWSQHLSRAIFVLSGALIQFGIIYVFYHYVFGLSLNFFLTRHPIQQDSAAASLLTPVSYSDPSLGDFSPQFTVERAISCAKLHNWILKHSHEAFDAKTQGLNYTWPVNDQAGSDGELATKTKEEEDTLITQIYKLQSGNHRKPVTIDQLDTEKFKQLPLYVLLTGLNYTPQPDLDSRETAFLTPLVENARFWKWKFFPYPLHGSLPHPKTIVELFPGHSVRLSQNFIFDYKTGMAAWAPLQWYIRPLPKQGDWAPLEYFLESWKKEWEIGRYYWHSVDTSPYFSQGPTIQRWMIDYDLNPAIEEWNNLLEAIQGRLPKEANRNDQQKMDISSQWLPPVAAKISEERFRRAVKYDNFATTFLQVAKRPVAFKYVAPGIVVWSDAEFAHQIDKAVKGDPTKDRITPLGFPLLLASDPLSSSHGLERLSSWRLSIPFDWEGTWWDKENLALETMKNNDRWIYSGLLDNKLGLYSTDNQYVGGSYWLILERQVDGTPKVDDEYQRMFVCSFGQGSANTGYQGRGGRVALIFRKFREFVESGVWQVGLDGVSTGVEWFQDAKNRNLTWVYNE